VLLIAAHTDTFNTLARCTDVFIFTRNTFYEQSGKVTFPNFVIGAPAWDNFILEHGKLRTRQVSAESTFAKHFIHINHGDTRASQQHPWFWFNHETSNGRHLPGRMLYLKYEISECEAGTVEPCLVLRPGGE